MSYLKEMSCHRCNLLFVARSPKAKWCSPKCGQSQSYINNMQFVDFRLGKLVAMAKNRSKEKKLPFNIDTQYLVEMWEIQGGKCCISGREFSLDSGKNRVNQDTPSLDRITPSLGYVKGNVRLVTYHTNVALSEFGLEALYQLIADIQNNKGK